MKKKENGESVNWLSNLISLVLRNRYKRLEARLFKDIATNSPNLDKTIENFIRAVKEAA